MKSIRFLFKSRFGSGFFIKKWGKVKKINGEISVRGFTFVLEPSMLPVHSSKRGYSPAVQNIYQHLGLRGSAIIEQCVFEGPPPSIWEATSD